jgi:hypothetical protein
MPEDHLRPLRKLRKDLADAIVEYDRHIPHADGDQLADLLHHRAWNYEILADLARLPHAARP